MSRNFKYSLTLGTVLVLSLNAYAAPQAPDANMKAPATTTTATPPPPLPPPPKAIPSSTEVIVSLPKHADISVSVPPVYGRAAVEYFYTPIVGTSYTDVTQISQSFIVPEHHNFANSGSGDTIPVNNTSLGSTVGFLVDGQYQITSTDYWRGGFQTGIIYASNTVSDFRTEVCVDYACSDSTTDYIQKGSLGTDEFVLPLLFTFSHYAKSDDFIVTFKLGAMVSFLMYDLDFSGFDLSPTREFQTSLGLGIDGRYRLPGMDQFILVGFNGGSLFGGGNSFSGVEVLSDFMVYVGYSFS